MDNGYQIIQENSYVQELERFKGGIQRADDLVRHVEYMLLRNPRMVDHCRQITQHVWCASAKRLLAYYTIEDNPKQVILHSILQRTNS